MLLLFYLCHNVIAPQLWQPYPPETSLQSKSIPSFAASPETTTITHYLARYSGDQNETASDGHLALSPPAASQSYTRIVYLE